MIMNRLLGIIYILMRRKTVTAAELAERYEVSVRTIYRDVDAIAMAGIPIYTQKGKNGGIRLTEEFVLDRMLVTKEEQEQILAALTTLDEIGAEDQQDTLQKLGDFFRVEPRNWVSVDLSDWSGRNQELFQTLKQAVLGRRVLSFDYYGQYGNMSSRRVEPVQLLFKDYTWYLRAYCLERQDMRLFKILRMKRLVMEEETFLPDPDKYLETEPPPSREQTMDFPETTLVLRIEGTEAYRIYDRFEEEEITQEADGSFTVKYKVLLDDWVYGMIFSFGPAAAVLEPEAVREEVKRRLNEMEKHYTS